MNDNASDALRRRALRGCQGLAAAVLPACAAAPTDRYENTRQLVTLTRQMLLELHAQGKRTDEQLLEADELIRRARMEVEREAGRTLQAGNQIDFLFRISTRNTAEQRSIRRT